MSWLKSTRRPSLMGGIVCAIVCIALFSSTAAFADGTNLRRLALVVASNDGGEERPTLRHAVSDARAFSKVLEELGGVRSADMTLVKEPDVSQLKGELERFGKKVAKAKANSERMEVIVYYSGHSDRRGLLLGEERFTYKELRSQLDTLSADVRLVVLDSCATGEMTRTKGGKRRPAFLADESSLVTGYAVLTSSSGDEAAQESDELGASFFTHFLNSGLRGAADVNADSRVTLSEAYQFAFHQTLARTEKTSSGAQHAAYDMDLSGRGDLVLTDLRQTSTSLVLSKSLSGRVYVREKSGTLAVELDKRAGKQVTLGLPAGVYQFTLAGDKVSQATVKLTAGDSKTVGADEFETISRQEARARGVVTGDQQASSWTSEQPVGLDRQFHLSEGMAEFRVGAGIVDQIHWDDGREPKFELGYRRGISERLSYVFPLILSGQLWRNQRAQWVLTGGLSGLGYSSIGGVLTAAGMSSDWQYRVTESLALNLGASTTAAHTWGDQSSQWSAGASISATWRAGERLSGGLGVGYGRSQSGPGVSSWSPSVDSPIYEPEDTLFLGATGGRAVGNMPLLQVRLWRGLHLYESSTIMLAPETLEPFSHSHLLGISWYSETGE